MTARRLLCLIALGLAGVAAAAPAASAAPRQAAKDGGHRPCRNDGRVRLDEPLRRVQRDLVRRVHEHLPTLVQYDTHYKIVGDWATSWKTSKDGLTWTFKLKPGKWSDGKPVTADDAAWTGNTILKYAKGPSASLAPFISHATKLTAPNPTTLVIHYSKAVANVLPQLQQFFILPRHIWEPVVGTNAKGLKDYDPAATCRSSEAAPSSCRSTTRRARRSSRATRASTGRSRTSTPSASRGSRTRTRCWPRSRATASTTSTRCRRRSRARWAPRVTSRSSRARLRGARLRLQLEPEEEEESRAARSQGSRRALPCVRPQADHRRGLPRARRSAGDVAHAHLGALHEHRPAAREVRP